MFTPPLTILRSFGVLTLLLAEPSPDTENKI